MAFILNLKYRSSDVRNFRLLTIPPVRWAVIVTSVLVTFSLFLIIFISTSTFATAITLLSLGVWGAALLVYSFGHTYFPYKIPIQSVAQLNERAKQSTANAADAITFDLALILRRRERQGQAGLTSFVRDLVGGGSAQHLLNKLTIDPATLDHALEHNLLPALTWDQFANDLVLTAAKLKFKYITPEAALGALLLNPAMRVWLRGHDLTEADVRFVLWWGAEHSRLARQRQRWWDADHLLSFTGLGLAFAAGYTPLVDKFARLPKGSPWDSIIYGHEDKVVELTNSLARQRQSNVLLVGDPGTGRLGIIRATARAVRNNTAHRALTGQRLVYINVGELIAQGTTGASQLALVSRVLREMERAGNIIAVIDGLTSALGRAGEAALNITDLLLPFLSSSNVRVVVISSSEDYHLRLKTNAELIHYFDVVQVPSLDPEHTKRRLALTAAHIERSAGLTIPYRTIKSLVEDTASIMPQIPYPERAFDFLEEAIVLAQTEHAKVLEPRHITTLISQKVGVNLGALKKNEREQLLNLEEIMHRRLVNQNRAVTALSRALIRARAEVRSTDRPIGSFLFLGPTGVGKTETAKTLAEAYFGSAKNMVRLDMSEFQGSDAVARLIGSASHPTGRLTSLIADHPFTVLLLDEFEKAAPTVHQLFLQILDEGHLTDASGRDFSFINTIIIATSNAGAELIRQAVKGGQIPAGFDTKLKEHILSNNLLRPELLNRFDGVITYTPLTPQHIAQIAELMLRSLNQRLDNEHGITVAITPALVKFLVKIGYNPEFGARPMSRAIQNTVEFAVAQAIIKGQTEPGQLITLNPTQLADLI